MRRALESVVLVSALIAGACTGSILDPGSDESGSSGPGGSSATSVKPGVVGRSPLRRLTAREYRNTLEDLCPNLALPAAELPSESELHGFDNNADVQVASAALIEAYEASARAVAAAVVDGGNPASCTQDELTCGKSFVGELARRAYRRPPDSGERQRLESFFSVALGKYSFTKALEVSIAAVLQTPQFLYRLEPSSSGADEYGAIPLDNWELASRLSYFIWASMPDEQLFAAAAAGTLTSADELEAQARRMLQAPRARQMVVDFHAQWLDLDRLERTSKDATLYPEFSEVLRASMRAETEAFVEHVVFDGAGTLRALLTEPKTFVDAELAPIYGILAPAGSTLSLVDLDPSQRAGLLTQPSFLAGHAHPKITSPVLRGVTLLRALLCVEPDPPPPGVDTSITMGTAPSTPKTTREIYEQHVTDSVCKSCHSMIDPLGMPFESFDAIGRHRSQENGMPVDSSATIEDLLGEGQNAQVSGAVELARSLADSPRVSACVARQWFRFAMGRADALEDTPAIESAHARFEQQQGLLTELLVGIVRSKAFRTRKVEDSP